MKPEPQAPANHTFQSVKELEAHSKTRMDKVLSDLQHAIASIRTGRASVGIFDNIKVDYYGTPTPAQSGGQSARARALAHYHSALGRIADRRHRERPSAASDLGLNPANDGKLIRVPVPPLTEERRKEIVKRLHNVAEEHRVAARNIRRDANEHLKKLLKDKLISEDEERRALDDVQKITDAHIQKIDAASKAKETEIMGGK